MTETKTTNYPKIKVMIGVALIVSVSTVATVFAFGESDARRINAVSKKMAEVTSDIAMAEIKMAGLTSDRNVLNEKIDLVQNHIDEQNKALNAFKEEIGGIIGGDFTLTEK